VWRSFPRFSETHGVVRSEIGEGDASEEPRNEASARSHTPSQLLLQLSFESRLSNIVFVD
jgi:hypothetical protein